MLDRLPPILLRVLRETPELTQAYLVGGGVRDWLLGVPGHDFDIEVFGVGYGNLVAALGRWGRADLVGRSFGVVKLTVGGETFDFSLPRLDSKVAPGHTGFTVEFDPMLTPRDAAARRDFTINSLMYDPRSGELLDFFGGAADLKDRVLRHTSEAFVEDPLRVLRGMQFAGRFDLTAAPETLALCRSIANTYSELALERVREEWFKWASKSARPSSGMRFLRDSGWLRHFPEAALLIGVPQDPGWHPEGDVWTHTLHCLDALAEQPDWQAADEPTRIVVMLAVLAHDFAKPACTHTDMRHGSLRIVSPGHEMAGGPLAESFLQRLGMPEVLADRIPPLVANHLAHLHDITPRSVRRLAQRLSPATIRELSWVMVADAFGRPPLPRQILPSVHELLALAAELDVQRQAPRAILLGRHLVERGLTPGPTFKPLLDAAFEAQLDGIFTDLEGAQAWLDRRLPATAAQPA